MSIIVLITLLLLLFALVGAIKHKANISDFSPLLAANVATTIITPFLFGISMLID